MAGSYDIPGFHSEATVTAFVLYGGTSDKFMARLAAASLFPLISPLINLYSIPPYRKAKNMIGVFPLLFFLVQIQKVFSTPCAQRFYPSLFETRIVCVCNATFCDEYEDTPLTTGTAQIFSSSERGDRMNSRSAPVLNGYQGSWLSARISVNPAVTYHEIIGFGGAFTDAAGKLFRSVCIRRM
ncbi:hypothetical protein PRIPAC_78725 [Pristionchus pacificus]|uniref:Glucosylceramidase n=1 Tax=Pristionchus pacificus TaxID=54126 RepID=A0A2A6CKG2_PRIPA|nr:hypothetical protein PRIPAC_78725 [Pristionchus pacificus]|eukprot:PDM78609.1 glycoside hydrolase [Pristionchus pacificus]